MVHPDISSLSQAIFHISRGRHHVLPLRGFHCMIAIPYCAIATLWLKVNGRMVQSMKVCQLQSNVKP